ncbi:MAG: hypothetical protein U9N87_01675 [Planctomycetota bacterium]|nr:hypothetical protein [Planctomycetota bacterium]
MSENRSATSDPTENADLTGPPRQPPAAAPPVATPQVADPQSPPLPEPAAPPRQSDPAAAQPQPPQPTSDCDPAAAPAKPARRRWSIGRQTTGFLSSVVFHAALLIALALAIETTISLDDVPFGIEISPQDTVRLESSENTPPDRLKQRDRLEGQTVAVNVPYDDPHIDDQAQGPTGLAIKPGRLHPLGIDAGKLTLDDNSPRGGGLEGRGRSARAQLLPIRGGTPQSEAAVAHGLKWLAYHQRDDGSWNFNHHGNRCREACRNPGSEPSTTAATALALLPFLGAGHTHTSDEYGQLVERGLYYLNNKASFEEEGADLRDGTMYGQGLAAIALCEAYSMTKESTLKGLAQKSIDYIVFAQDKKGGGWRYDPGQPGDTTVTGWQLMALKSAQMADLNVPSPAFFMAQGFLDSVSSEYGSRYGYLTRENPGRTTTAIGLLCRMYTGWHRNRPALVRGVELLDKWEPSKTDMYFNYYATQVLCHFDGPPWERWNPKMRDYLIATQAASGHEAGSWYFPDRHGDKGGRLYNTAVAVMILEVYYRYMPLYEREAVGYGL